MPPVLPNREPSRSSGLWRHRPRMGVVAVAAVVVVSVLAGVTPPTAAASAAARHVVLDSSAYDWSQLGKDPAHTATATNSGINTSDAGRLGVRWAANLHGAALSSPIVDFRGKHGMVVYAGNVNGDFMAFSLATGRLLWARALGSQIDATPVSADGAVWVETQNPPRLYKLNPLTGSTECSVVANGYLDASLTAAKPPGGALTVYAAAMDTPHGSGPIFAVAAANCRTEWSFTNYATAGTGPWAPISYGVDAQGTPLVFDGTADPDSSEYAVNARTGQRVWDFQTAPPGDYDVGAGLTVSPPGVNGFADGVAYLPSKYGVLYARDLTTGAALWSYNFGLPSRTRDATQTGRSTAALSGANLVFGHLGGVTDLNAKTGAVTWRYQNPTGTEVISSVAIAGPVGRQVVICADLSGAVHVLSLATGHSLYSYQTGGYIVPSPAVSGNDVLISSSDGFLYDLAVGGGNDARLPSVSISSPVEGASVGNPNGDLTIHGQATDTRGVAQVGVVIQDGGTAGGYWDAATRSWVAAPIDNLARLAHPGAAATSFTAKFPVPSYGGVYTATATAWSRSGQPGVHPSQVSFRVPSRTRGPRLALSSGFLARGGTVTVTGVGFTPRSKVALTLSGRRFATVTASRRGGFRAGLSMGAGQTFGYLQVLASGHRQSASIPVIVSDPWAGAGAGPRHPGYEADDTAYAVLYYVGSMTGMARAWELAVGSAIDTGSAMVHEVTYVGTRGGQLVAAHSHDGAVWWTWTDPDRSAVTGTPAVDPGTKRVVVTSAGDGVYALTTAGHRIWTARTPATPGSPVLADGLVLVSSANGTLTAFRESSGAVVWTQALAGPLSDAAVDVSTGQVFVGEDNGSVAALSLAHGSTEWTSSLGSAVADAPAVANGRLYVTTTGGSLVALQESGGAEAWSYSAGGPITGAPVVMPSTPVATPAIYLGSGGDMVSLNLNGSVRWSTPLDCTPVGLAAVEDTAFATCQNGVLSAVRPWGEIGWQYRTSGSVSSAPSIADAAVSVGDAQGDLYAFTPYGIEPGVCQCGG